jgi:SHS2 domain-containing protein
MRERKPVFRTLEHTADLRMEIRGRDLPDLFGNAVRALYALLGPPRDAEVPPACGSESLLVSGVDLEDLLVRLLGELLYRVESDSTRFWPHHITLGGECPLELRLVGCWQSFSRATRRGGREIKAVTYHGTEIRGGKGGLRASVVLDV